MRRRILVAALALVIVGAPLAAGAQQAGEVSRFGVIGEVSPTDPFPAAFRHRLREHGYTEGQSIVIEYRYAHGVLDRVPDLAAELIRLKVDVLMDQQTLI